ncbi:hypothetical protein MMC30_003728 [Trapelia coarctata]|nr:hypothetical protein [Trapelia coarctata]
MHLPRFRWSKVRVYRANVRKSSCIAALYLITLGPSIHFQRMIGRNYKRLFVIERAISKYGRDYDVAKWGHCTKKAEGSGQNANGRATEERAE